MREFTDERGRAWRAGAIEEDTPRHHGRWYLYFRPADAETPRIEVPDVRWQTLRSAERTLGTMSVFDLRRRLAAQERRAGVPAVTGAGGAPWMDRNIHDR